MADTVRCFVAVELPEPVKKELVGLAAVLKAKCPPVVKWVEPDGIHLTLKFLGSVSPEQVGEIKMAIDDAAAGVAPFSLEVRDLGAFPNLNRVQVVWVGLKGQLDRLACLQQRVEKNMAGLGFAKEEREFTAHLTLGRVRNYTLPEDRRRIGRALTETAFAPDLSMTVESVCLMRSQLTPSGAIYSRLHEAILKE